MKETGAAVEAGNISLLLPGRVFFGYGAIDEVGTQLRRLAMRRPLIVADAGIERAGILERIHRPHGSALFVDVQSNPTEAEVMRGAAIYHDSGCDGVVAVGGGSVLDTGKLVALLAAGPGRLSQYDHVHGGMDVPGELPPVIAVSTTAGSGSEVGRAALVMLNDDSRKVLIVHDRLIPRVAIADPGLTLGLPPHLTAATGMDALSHCIEELFCPRFHPLVDTLASEGIRLIARYLVRAVENGSDIEARQGMMRASLYGGMGFLKGLGAVHALSHPLATIGAHHGTVNAILLPYVFDFNAEIAPDVAMHIESLFGRGCGAVVLDDLLARCGLPTRLSDLGMTADHIPSMVSLAMLENSRSSNPRPLEADDAADLYLRALS